QKHVRLVTGAEDLAGTDTHLENRRPAGNRGGNGHERHDLLFAATGQPGQKPADRLNAVLGITGNADDRLVDLDELRSAVRRLINQSCITHEMWSKLCHSSSANDGCRLRRHFHSRQLYRLLKLTSGLGVSMS